MYEKKMYRESSRKRHEISQDEISRERVYAIRDFSAELRRNFPELGFMVGLYGSLSKGKELSSKKDADIDMSIIIDLEDANKLVEDIIENGTDIKLRTELEENIATVRKTNDSSIRSTSFWSEDREQEYIRHLEHKVNYEAFRLYVLKQIADLFSKLGAEKDERYIDIFSIEGGGEGIIKTIRRLEEDLYMQHLSWEELIPNGHPDVRFLVGVFGLQIGGTRKKYLKEFFELLDSYAPVQANSYWQLVAACVRYFERRHEIPDTISHRFPETVEEAKKYYGIS